MIPSVTQCNSYIIIYQFQLSKFKKGEILMIPSLTQCNSYIIIYQFQLSKLKKAIHKLSNCNKGHSFKRVFLSRKYCVSVALK